MTGAVLFALSLRGPSFPQTLLERTALVSVLLLAVLGWASWMRRYRIAIGSAFGLAGLQAFLPCWQGMRAGGATLELVMPVMLWGVALAANARKERREVYFDA